MHLDPQEEGLKCRKDRMKTLTLLLIGFLFSLPQAHASSCELEAYRKKKKLHTNHQTIMGPFFYEKVEAEKALQESPAHPNLLAACEKWIRKNRQVGYEYKCEYSTLIRNVLPDLKGPRFQPVWRNFVVHGTPPLCSAKGGKDWYQKLRDCQAALDKSKTASPDAVCAIAKEADAICQEWDAFAVIKKEAECDKAKASVVLETEESNSNFAH